MHMHGFWALPEGIKQGVIERVATQKLAAYCAV